VAWLDNTKGSNTVSRIFRPYPMYWFFSFALISLLAIYAPGAQGAATFTLTNLDSPNEGFNDNSSPDPVSQAAGNPGKTLGEQRLWAFQKAAEFWGQRLNSSVNIEVEINMDPLSCSAFSGALGSAGPKYVVMDWPAGGGSAPPLASTWYHAALGNRIAASDLGSVTAEIGATFNSDIDNNNSCLSGINWFYGLGGAAPAGTISFFSTVLHELGHGLGFSTFVNVSTGARFLDFNDVYMTSLEDHSLGITWPNMTDPQRQASAIDISDLHWVGPAGQAGSADLSSGVTGNHVHMYAPSPVELGSSVSHWDTSLVTPGGYSEVMEPFATAQQMVVVTDEMLNDEGWNVFEGDCSAANDTLLIQSQDITSSQQYEACFSITAGNLLNILSPAGVSFRAGRSITLTDQFRVEAGATFSATVDPLMTLRDPP